MTQLYRGIEGEDGRRPESPCADAGTHIPRSPASELEWLGFELALRRYFGITNTPAALMTKLVRRGHIVSRTPDLIDALETSQEAVWVYVHYLRDALKDLGFACKIEGVRGEGYRLSSGGAEEIWQRVLAVVFHL